MVAWCREGSALGRKAEESEGLKEPIGISLRTDRSGLGRLEEIQRVSEEQFRQKKVNVEHNTTHTAHTTLIDEHTRARTRPGARAESGKHIQGPDEGAIR